MSREAQAYINKNNISRTKSTEKSQKERDNDRYIEKATNKTKK